MITIEVPPGFVVRTEAQKAAFDNGYRLERGTDSGWMCYASTTARSDIWIAGSSQNGPWLLSLEFPDLAEEIGIASSTECLGPGSGTFIFETLDGLYSALDRAYRLGVSLPDAPLQRFRTVTCNMPQTTETECLAVRRIGQSLFRQALLDYWNGRCPLTGITDEPLLRASHIVAWADCETDTLRLDVHNGLLLSALWDAVFDAGLISFADDGTVLASPRLTPSAANALRLDCPRVIAGLTNAHRKNLALHRLKHGF